MNSANQIDNDPLINLVGLPSQDFPKSALYVVGLPIGNFADITLRALWVLSHADVIAAEDTRQTRKILDKFNISAQLLSVHQHNEHEGASKILECLSNGRRVALVTDAGTPAVSDPGTKVVRTVEEAGFRVIPVPGASAVITAVSAAGMEPEGFIFHGFLEGGSQERARTLKQLSETCRTFVLYEAPHRIKKLCEEISESVPADRRLLIARELTKKFESLYTLTAGQASAWCKTHNPQGEYVLVVNAAKEGGNFEVDEDTRKWLSALSDQLPPKSLAKAAAEATGIPKNDLYQYLLKLKQNV